MDNNIDGSEGQAKTCLHGAPNYKPVPAWCTQRKKKSQFKKNVQATKYDVKHKRPQNSRSTCHGRLSEALTAQKEHIRQYVYCLRKAAQIAYEKQFRLGASYTARRT